MPFFVSSFVSIFMFLMSMLNESPQRRMSSIECHTCAPGKKWMQLRLCTMARLLRYPWVAWQRSIVLDLRVWV